MVSPISKFSAQYPTLTMNLGRQTPHSAATRVFAEQVHRHRSRRHNEARVDVEHRTRLLRKLPRAPATPTLYEHRYGSVYGEGSDALYGEDGAACWAGAGGGGMI